MKNKWLLMVLLMLFPSIVFAMSDDSALPIGAALGMELFISIHMAVFVLKPLSKMFSKENDKKLFWNLFIIRAVILLFSDFFVTTMIALVDFIAVFIGAFIVVPICSMITKTSIDGRNNQVIENTVVTNNTVLNMSNVVLKCTKCNSLMQVTDKFCANCGAPFEGDNVTVEMGANANFQVPPKIKAMPSDFDKMYSLNEELMLEEFINRELVKCGVDKNSDLIPSDILKKKHVFNIIFLVLLFVFVSMIFFHFPIYTYIIGLILLIIFFKVTRNYNLVKYLKKQLKARPSEKVSNIVMNVKSTFVSDDSKKFFSIGLCFTIFLPMVIFFNPRIMYEKMDHGYGVRFYTFGLTNFTTATIPSNYNGDVVVSLRGNTFSNMFLLKKVSLPDTIIEIRGQAFKNDFRLVDVNIPSKLEYLGGGAFYNCTSITSIELPNTLTYMGGETFYNAKKLQNVKLSTNLTEIRGNSFENCSLLESITIPDGVKRIGGHAFYGNSSLSEVIFTENSQLTEIGSSAFRRCLNLYDITLPESVYINERAFKESPTSIKYFSNNYYNQGDLWN